MFTDLAVEKVGLCGDGNKELSGSVSGPNHHSLVLSIKGGHHPSSICVMQVGIQQPFLASEKMRIVSLGYIPVMNAESWDCVGCCKCLAEM